jgi:hypothetical protein
MAMRCSSKVINARRRKRFRDIISAITADLGGVDRLSEGQKQLIKRCSLISVECKSVAGEDINLDLFGTLTDRLGRTLQRLGLRRLPKVIGPLICRNIFRDRQNASCEDAPGSPPALADCILLGAAIGSTASWLTWLSVAQGVIW